MDGPGKGAANWGLHRAACKASQNCTSDGRRRGRAMTINKQSDIAADLQIGPTDQGMVRIFVAAEGGIELPLDFDPDEADEIAEELRAAAEAARDMQSAKGGRRR